jgi:pyruvyl transferase EpsO
VGSEPLADRYVDTLRRVLGGTWDVALVDVPVHTNVGDAAIWLGEVEALKALGVRVRYVCHLRGYDAAALRRRLGDGVVLLHGGGNLGDLWPAHQALRERVLEDFPDRPVVQLPQTVCFRSEDAVHRARRAFAEHPRLTLLVRDGRSLEAVRRDFDTPALLCPDGAFCLPEPARGPPERETLWLLRTDHEAAERRSLPGVEPVDWLDEPPSRRVRAARVLDGVGGAGGPVGATAAALALRLHLQAARRRYLRGCALLSSARVVVSDRLHAHVLCLSLGVPHVLLDDRFGKIRAFVRTWTEASPLVHVARDVGEAEGIAAAILKGT